MNDYAYIRQFKEKLIGIFETRAEEFTKRSEENPSIACVATELAELYQDLARIMRS